MKKTKTCAENTFRAGRFIFYAFRLLPFDRADGAALFASAAVDADIGIDLILGVALRNRIHGASICASAAGDAVFRNFMCHILLPPNNISFPRETYPRSAENIITQIFTFVKAKERNFFTFFHFFAPRVFSPAILSARRIPFHRQLLFFRL